MTFSSLKDLKYARGQEADKGTIKRSHSFLDFPTGPIDILQEEVGAGTRGSVRVSEDGKFAIKTGTYTKKTKERFQKEVKLINQIYGPNSARVFFYRNSEYRLIKPWFEGETVEKVLKSSQHDPIQTLIVYIHIVAELIILHSKNVYHGDVSIHNILFDSTSRKAHYIDFDCSSELLTEAGLIPETLVANEQCIYWAPERVLQQKAPPVHVAQEVFSVGCLSKFVSLPFELQDSSVSQLITDMRNPDPNQRPNLYYALYVLQFALLKKVRSRGQEGLDATEAFQQLPINELSCPDERVRFLLAFLKPFERKLSFLNYLDWKICALMNLNAIFEGNFTNITDPDLKNLLRTFVNVYLENASGIYTDKNLEFLRQAYTDKTFPETVQILSALNQDTHYIEADYLPAKEEKEISRTLMAHVKNIKTALATEVPPIPEFIDRAELKTEEKPSSKIEFEIKAPEVKSREVKKSSSQLKKELATVIHELRINKKIDFKTQLHLKLALDLYSDANKECKKITLPELKNCLDQYDSSKGTWRRFFNTKTQTMRDLECLENVARTLGLKEIPLLAIQDIVLAGTERVSVLRTGIYKTKRMSLFVNPTHAIRDDKDNKMSATEMALSSIIARAAIR